MHFNCPFSDSKTIVQLLFMFSFAKFYNLRLVQACLGTDQSNLGKLVEQTWSVLDLGCGSNPPILRVLHPKSYFGVDGFEPSVESVRQYCLSQNLEHYEFTVQSLESVQFEENQFDVVLLIDVIEHLPKEIGEALLEDAKGWASRLIYVSTPNGFLRQDPYDSNAFQEHLSGWTINDFKSRGFESIRGGGGLRVLRKQEMQPDQWSHVSGASLRWRPRFFWAILSGLSQMIFKRLPSWSYQIIAVYAK